MENRVMSELADDAKIIETIVRAHFDSCDYTADKIKPFIAKALAEKQFTQCTGMVSTLFSLHPKVETWFTIHSKLILYSFTTAEKLESDSSGYKLKVTTVRILSKSW